MQINMRINMQINMEINMQINILSKCYIEFWRCVKNQYLFAKSIDCNQYGMLRVDLRAPAAPILLSTDASSSADSSAASFLPPELSLELTRHGLQRGLWAKLPSTQALPPRARRVGRLRRNARGVLHVTPCLGRALLPSPILSAWRHRSSQRPTPHQHWRGSSRYSRGGARRAPIPRTSLRAPAGLAGRSCDFSQRQVFDGFS